MENFDRVWHEDVKPAALRCVDVEFIERVQQGNFSNEELEMYTEQFKKIKHFPTMMNIYCMINKIDKDLWCNNRYCAMLTAMKMHFELSQSNEELWGQVFEIGSDLPEARNILNLSRELQGMIRY